MESLVVLGSWPWCSRDDMVSSSVTEQVIGFMVSAGMQHTSHAFAAPATRQPHTPLQWSRFFKGFKLWASREDGGGRKPDFKRTSPTEGRPQAAREDEWSSRYLPGPLSPWLPTTVAL